MISTRWRILIGTLVVLLLALPVCWFLLFAPLLRETQRSAPTPALQAVLLATPPPTALVVLDPTAVMATAAATTLTVDEPFPALDPATATVLAQDEFYNLLHSGRGRALLIKLPDGTLVLRFEDFEVLNGPDLRVLLVPIHPVPATRGADIVGAVDLGPLKGNVGDQNYVLPPGLDIEQFKSVVIWSQSFKEPFIAAPLLPLKGP